MLAALAGVGGTPQAVARVPTTSIPEPIRIDQPGVRAWSLMLRELQMDVDLVNGHFSGPTPEAISGAILQRMFADASVSHERPSPFAYIPDPAIHLPDGDMASHLLDPRIEFKL